MANADLKITLPEHLLARLSEVPAVYKRQRQRIVAQGSYTARQELARRYQLSERGLRNRVRDGHRGVWVGVDPISSRDLRPRAIQPHSLAGQRFPGSFPIAPGGRGQRRPYYRVGSEPTDIRAHKLEIAPILPALRQLVSAVMEQALEREVVNAIE